MATKKAFKFLFGAFDSRDSYDPTFEAFVRANDETEGRQKFAKRMRKKGWDEEMFSGILVLDTIPNC